MEHKDTRRVAVGTARGIWIIDGEDVTPISGIGIWTGDVPPGQLPDDRAIAWAPDGSAVAFRGVEGDGIYIAAADGSGVYQLTAGFATPLLGWLPEIGIVYALWSGGA